MKSIGITLPRLSQPTFPHALSNRLPLRSGNQPLTYLEVTPPLAGQVRVRRIIHRGAPRPTAKVPSIKLGRTVHCESLLEADAAKILDACPQVTSFGEQPVVLHYFDGWEWRSHIPDFAVSMGCVYEFVEIKFKRDIDAEVMRRTALLKQLLMPRGIQYRLLSEDDLRTGCRLDNASRLLLRGREQGSNIWALRVFEAVRSHGVLSLRDFGWDRPGQPETAWIAREILDGRLQADLSRPIDADTKVIVPHGNFKESRLWPLAAS